MFNVIKKYKISILIFINSLWIGFGIITYLSVHFDLFLDEDTTSLLYISICSLIFSVISTYYFGVRNTHTSPHWFLSFLLYIGAIFVLSITILFYLLSDGFRDYKKYCSHFVPILDHYHTTHHSYPNNLSYIDDKSIWNIRYDADNCGYRLQDDGVYTFYFYEGMIAIGYDSKTNKWVKRAKQFKNKNLKKAE